MTDNNTTHWPKNGNGRARVRKFNNNPICYYCDHESKRLRKFTVDHVNPASKGGKNGDNLVLACKVCNRDKQDYTPEEYMALCIKRAKRVMFASNPPWRQRVALFFKVMMIWVKTGPGKR